MKEIEELVRMANQDGGDVTISVNPKDVDFKAIVSVKANGKHHSVTMTFDEQGNVIVTPNDGYEIPKATELPQLNEDDE